MGRLTARMPGAGEARGEADKEAEEYHKEYHSFEGQLLSSAACEDREVA